MYDRLKLPRGAQRNAAPNAEAESEDARDTEADDGESEEDEDDDASEQEEEEEATPRKFNRKFNNRKFKGVFRSIDGRTNSFKLCVPHGGGKIQKYGFPSATAAACAYDEAAREHGVRARGQFSGCCRGRGAGRGWREQRNDAETPWQRRRSSAAHCAHTGACGCAAAQAQPLALACWRAARQAGAHLRRPLGRRRSQPRRWRQPQAVRRSAHEPGGIPVQHLAAALAGAPFPS
jgi:hypothetical protein